MIETEIEFLLYPDFSQSRPEVRALQRERLKNLGNPSWTCSGTLYKDARTVPGIYQPSDFTRDVNKVRDAVTVRQVQAVYKIPEIGYAGVYTYRGKGTGYQDAHALWDAQQGPMDSIDILVMCGGADYSWSAQEGRDSVVKYARVEDVCSCGSTWRIIRAQGESVDYICPCCGRADRPLVISLEPVRLAGLGLASPFPEIAMGD